VRRQADPGGLLLLQTLDLLLLLLLLLWCGLLHASH
jgi:hypothetical protein